MKRRLLGLAAFSLLVTGVTCIRRDNITEFWADLKSKLSSSAP